MPFGSDQAALDLMHEIDWIFLQYPFFGSREIAAYFPQPMLLSCLVLAWSFLAWLGAVAFVV
jgi:hypothetical protein